MKKKALIRRRSINENPGGKSLAVDTSDVFLRFWDQTDRMSSTALSVENSPHFRIAKTTLEMLENTGRTEGIEQTSEFREYRLHIEHENLGTGAQLRDPKQFVRVVEKYRREGVDLDKRPIRVSLIEKALGDRALYYIRDGAHRAAFVAAYNAVMLTNTRLKIYVVPNLGRWPHVEQLA